MKLKFLFCLILGGALTASAQGGYQDGVDNFNAGRLDVAKVILNNTLNQPGTNKAVSYYYLGQIAYDEGDMAAAKSNFDKGVAADPNYGYNYIGLGQLALKNGNKGEAEKYFNDVLKLNKKNTEMLAGVARAYYNVDPVAYAKEIDKNIAKALKDSKNTEPAVYLLQGDMEAANNPGAAAGKYEMAIEQDRAKGEVNSEAYVKYANAYFRVSPKFAIQKLEELNELQPNSALAQRELAEKYYDNNQFGSAYLQYGKYLQNPNHFQKDEKRYVALLYSAGEYDKSLERANDVLKKDPSDYTMYRMILLNKSKKEDMAGAVEAGDKLFSFQNANFVPNDYIVYGDALLANGQGARAVEVYEKAIELNPDKPELMVSLSNVYEKAGMPEKAVDTMKKYLDAGNGSTNDIYSMARRYHGLARSKEEGTPERADAANEGLKYIEMAIAKVPDNGTLYRTKGELQLILNDNKITQEIANTYQKMLECYDADPANKEKYASSYRAAYYVIAGYYIDNDKSKAKEYYLKYLELSPDDESVRALVETIE